MLIPPGYLRWAAVGTGVVVLSVAIAVVVSLLGLFGPDAEQGTTVQATVVTGAPCDRAGATETVTFKQAGRDRQARFDGCGHAKGEPVDITVPAGATGDDLVVHAAQAAVGDREAGAGLGLLLLVLSGIVGAGYAFLVRRGPRTNRLPQTLRLA